MPQDGQHVVLYCQGFMLRVPLLSEACLTASSALRFKDEESLRLLAEQGLDLEEVR